MRFGEHTVDECESEGRADGSVVLEVGRDVERSGHAESEGDAGEGDGALGRTEVEDCRKTTVREGMEAGRENAYCDRESGKQPS